ncbi:hypothetical protein [Anaerotignum neopropionicum]|uniref:hypothetical protein n=1 Tax=Anaerotignum neopropionicum TaxID=36847 RepID=UPI0012FE587A|nr:hypothetical protein [Anaerotignum neopropionicum]
MGNKILLMVLKIYERIRQALLHWADAFVLKYGIFNASLRSSIKYLNLVRTPIFFA